MTDGVLGVGALGAAIVTGLCEDVDDAPEVLLSPRNAEIAAGLAQRFPTVEVAADNQAVVDGAAVVIVCVRPQVAETVLASCASPPTGSSSARWRACRCRRSSSWSRRPRTSLG